MKCGGIRVNARVNAKYLLPGAGANLHCSGDGGRSQGFVPIGFLRFGTVRGLRYETGRMLPPLALVKLLKLLDRHPELLEEVRAA